MTLQSYAQPAIMNADAQGKRFPWLSALIYTSVLLVAPFISEYLFAIAFAVHIYRMLRYDLRVNCIDLAFLIPYSSLYRLPGGVSYVVIYIFLFDLIFLFKKRKIYLGTGFALLLGTVAYVALRVGGMWNYLFFIFSGLLLLYILYVACKQTNYSEVLWAFVIGVILSSAYALAFGGMPAIRDIIMRDAEIRDNRFRGLLADPNYYTTFLILAIVALMCLNQRKRILRVLYFGSIAFLVFLGAQTVSKSFILMLVGVFIYCCINLLAKRKLFAGAALLTLGSVFAILVLSGQIEWFQAVVARFEEAEDMSGLTTGRTDIWKTYMRVILQDPFILLFGRGLDAPLIDNIGTHNIYLETVYCFGLGGLLLFFAFFRKIFYCFGNVSNRKLPILRFLPVVAILLFYFFLHGISASLFYLSLFIMYECYGCCVAEMAEKQQGYETV